MEGTKIYTPTDMENIRKTPARRKLAMDYQGVESVIAKATSSPVFQFIRRVAVDPRVNDCTDDELLRRFLKHNDHVAFETLARRHGPMVFDVCRALLPNEEDAEDAFQATFIILARKGNSIRQGASLASWLHGVAYRASMKARTEFVRRKKHEAQVATPIASETVDDPRRPWSSRGPQDVAHAVEAVAARAAWAEASVLEIFVLRPPDV